MKMRSWKKTRAARDNGREPCSGLIAGPGLRRRIEKQIEKGVKCVHKGVDQAVKTLDGTGLAGGALTEAYKEAKMAGNAAQFVANTAISNAERALRLSTLSRLRQLECQLRQCRSPGASATRLSEVFLP
ncbi:unnamed protein product [Symbiodinium sp. CCMP2456]|nr:unnamed protein product [Symbiodinium sp. CCMP2456]